MPRHADFEKIYQAFIKRYGLVDGEQNYYAWLSKMGLDDTKPYARPQEALCKDAFTWAKYLLTYLREDESKKYFKVEASFPLSSMNWNVYTEDELRLGARSLVGKSVNLNHDGKTLGSVSIDGAEYEDGSVECILGILKGSDILGMVEKGEIVHVSTEADCLQGTEMTPEGSVCKGLVYTGLALLTKEVLPGVPLTRIMPVEKIVESFQVSTNGGEKLVENDKGKTEEKKQGEVKKEGPKMEVAVKAEEGKETKTPCEEAKEALLVRVSALEARFKAIDEAEAKERKDAEEKAAADKKAQEALAQKPKPAVLTEKGFWIRFHELRGEGYGKTDAFRLLSLEVFEASKSKA